jgi:preprotein translocase subunit SecE
VATTSRETRKRVGARQFLKEVRQELKKVDWPTRKELGTYTVVVLATVVVLTTLVFGMDILFSKTVLNILGS